MTKINLKKLSITNFKGIKELIVNFTSHITNIYGDNATGKTTIVDAFLWLFFGKNSEEVSQFEVKRLDENNKFIENLEAEVEAIIDVNGQEIVVKKVLRQKWVKKRGELTAEYNGDENVYFWNDVPLKESEFKTKVKAIIDESLFKLTTNPFYFNNMKWQDRRNTLINIAGDITNTEILDSVMTVKNKGTFSALINALNSNKTVDEFKREIAVKKKKIKDEAETIPSRIDEVKRGMPEEHDFAALKSEHEAALEELKTIQDSLNNQTAANAAENKRRAALMQTYNNQVQDRQQKIFDIKTKMQNIAFDAKQAAGEASGKLNAEIKSLQAQKDNKNADITRFQTTVDQLKTQAKDQESNVQALREKYAVEDAKQLEFNEHEFTCPACKQDLPTGDIETKKAELTANFNTNKTSVLEKIINDAEAAKKDIADLNSRISNGEAAITKLKAEIKPLENNLQALLDQAKQPTQSTEDAITGILAANNDYQQLSTDLKATEALVIEQPVFDAVKIDEATNARRDGLNNKVAELTKQLHDEEIITKANARVEELQNQESTLAQELASLEGTEFAIMQFTKAKVDAIEKRINGKFSYVKFKLFATQVNGGEVECCDTLINSNGAFVPFSDANNAARINAGIDIINTLCNHYGITAPIFIDNRESVSVLLESSSQLVNLFVSLSDKKLRVA